MVTATPLHELDQFGSPAATGAAHKAAETEARRLAHRRQLEHAWIPIRHLRARHRRQILDHLVQLDEHDRYLRFGARAPLEQLSRYTAAIDFKRDEVFGIFNARLKLVAMAHLADLGNQHHPACQDGKAMEFGVSVLPSARGLGLGQRLFDHAMVHARNRGAKAIVIHALTENRPMLKIATRAGATLETSGPDAEAWLSLKPDTLATHLESTAQDVGAEVIFTIKARALRVRQWVKALFSAW
jgi:GNAT superfamily N-acetyltransferase